VDCDDADPTVHPGADDAWYDGIDSDCAGNDDFDQDRDGFPLEEDCDDEEINTSPDDPEVPYDGVDNDCDPSTPDTDLDADGFPPPDDCDDADSAIFPGALEVLGDGSDSDCDGDGDGGVVSYGGMLWEEPGRPSLRANDQHFLLSVTANLWQASGSGSGETVLGTAMWFELDAGGPGTAPVDDPLFWIGESTDDEYSVVDTEPAGDHFVLGSTYYSLVSLFGFALVQEVSWAPGVNRYLLGPGYFGGDPLVALDQADLMVDATGVGWTVTCGTDGLRYVKGTGTFPSPGGALLGVVDGSGGCFFEGTTTPPQATVCPESGGCTTFDLDPDAPDPTPALSANQPHNGSAWIAVRDHGGVVTALREPGGITVIDGPERWDLLDGETVIDAVATTDPRTGELFVAAVIDEVGSPREVVLLYGDPVGALTEVPVVLDDPPRDLLPEWVAVEVTEERVALAVSALDLTGVGGQDALGWIFWGR
jgi:hypothetical protein